MNDLRQLDMKKMFTNHNRFLSFLWLSIVLTHCSGCGNSAESDTANNNDFGNVKTGNAINKANSPESENSPSTKTSEQPKSEQPSEGTASHVVKDETNDSDKDYATRIIGIWQDEYQGKRTMTYRDDGTATMVVEPKGVAATLYASRMTFEEQWTISDGRLKLKAVGGEPKFRVNLVLKTMGSESEFEIVEVTQTRMLLRDVKDDSTYDWRRMKDE